MWEVKDHGKDEDRVLNPLILLGNQHGCIILETPLYPSIFQKSEAI